MRAPASPTLSGGSVIVRLLTSENEMGPAQRLPQGDVCLCSCCGDKGVPAPQVLPFCAAEDTGDRSEGLLPALQALRIFLEIGEG